MKVGAYATKDVVSVEPGSSIDKAITLMEEFGIHHLPVMEDGHVVGMLSDRDVLLGVGWKLSRERVTTPTDDDAPEILGPDRVGQIMSKPVVTIDSGQDAGTAARLMLEHRFNALPVVWENRLIGILTEADLLRHLQEEGHAGGPARSLTELPVNQFMRARVRTVSPRASIIEVIEILRQKHIHHLPVVVEGELVGIISDRDVRRVLAEEMLADMNDEHAGRMNTTVPYVLNVMTHDVKTLPSGATLGQAIDTCLEFHVHSLPVVQGQRVTGIITHRDMLRAALSEQVF